MLNYKNHIFLIKKLQKKEKKKKKNKIYFQRLCDQIHCSGFLLSFFQEFYLNSSVISEIDVSFEKFNWFFNCNFKIYIFNSFNINRNNWNIKFFN